MSTTTLIREKFSLYIGGKFVPGSSGKSFTTSSPYTGEVWADVAEGTVADIDTAVASARAALTGPWGEMTGTGRSALLRRLGDLIAENAERLATLEVNDSGKLFHEMIGQTRALPQWYYYYAGLADKIEGRQIPTDKPNFLVYTKREPVGVVGAITPWNSPLLLLTFKLAPALAAGCTFVVKPSEHAPASTAFLAELLDQAGFPPGVFNVVTGESRELGQALAAHPGVDKVAFTGSTATGALVAQAAGKNINKVTLELGGKSPQVVFEDADLEAAANGLLAGVFAATGQTCMAGSRLIVHESIHDKLVDLVVAKANEIKLGDPTSAETQMGPVANGPQYRKVMDYIQKARDENGVIACGGFTPEDLGGFFIRPTVITGVNRNSTVVKEEIFGPVLSVYTFTDETEAIELANDTEYGLAGAVWTKDVHRAHRVAGAIKAGTVWINAYRVLGPQVPFGGFGSSGIGRENGIEAINDYTETKSVWVELTGGTRDPFKLG
ncbi:aldehyde dehydrogenase [Pseudarthrobacter sp. NPDC058329]|uniref:aldehyde dehydrogenase n=1 Tax=Pseudarthrobacter sp. NPDC058329 TaxID=3346448 RepID=UPI0036D8996C